MIRKMTTRTTAATALVLALGANALAAPTVTIDSPADGTSVSRSQTPQLALAGRVSFETPAPSTRRLFLRYSGDDSSCGETYLSDLNGADGGNGCAQTLAVLSMTPDENDGWGRVYTSGEEVALPITIDAERNITGTLAYKTFLPDMPIFDIKVSFDGQLVGEQRHNPGLQTGVNVTRTINLNIDVPAAWDKKDVNEVTLDWRIQQSAGVAGSTWFEHDAPASFMTLPTFTASFDRRVEVSVANESFSSANVTLSPDLTTWTATRQTPAVGSHFLRAQAVQGGKPSGVAQTVLHVTA